MSRPLGEPYRRPKAHDWIAVGVPCWYQPALESRPFAGVVASDLWDDNGELVCKLEQMDERYLKRTGRDRIGRVPWFLLRKRRVKE